ncbi:MAG TPA: xylan 1,4-beta-xylosidase [Chloroflexota bacterium]|nr:xylan 1,4-beta-xylosidase [Chloroflexota bacterium]
MLVSIDRATRDGTSHLSVGVTHTQYSLDSWGDPAATAAGKQLLRTSAVYQNQHIMGWGGTNPEPSPGVYDWSRLDARVALIRQTGGIPVITLCCAPDWMWGGPAGTTDWSRLGRAPTPDHYADFAALAKQVARRYPDVKHFLVWNELKGFWKADLNRWDYQGYTTMYNLVYDALKSVSPDLQVGGPYVVVDSWGDRRSMSDPSDVTGPYGTLDQRPLDVISYWLANKHGADFVAVDAGCSNWDGVQLADEFTPTRKFADLAAWIGQRTNLPLWWAEWYCTKWGSSQEWDHQHQNAVMTSALIAMARSGAGVALRWQPQGERGQPYEGNTESIWSDTRQAGGGQPFPFYYSQRALKDHFPPGTPLYRATASSSDVEVLASADRTLLVNKRSTAAAVLVDGVTITLAGYEVRLLESPASKTSLWLPFAGR